MTTEVKKSSKAIPPIWTAIRGVRTVGFHSIAGHRGLYIRVLASGLRQWLLRAKREGKTGWLVIGSVLEEHKPDAGGLNFDGAKSKVERLKDQGREAQVSPVEAERAAKAERARQGREADEAKANAARLDALRPTLNRVAEKYLGVFVDQKRRATGKKRSAADDCRIYDRHIRPRLGMVRVEELRTRDVSGMRDLITATSEKRKAVSVLQALLAHARSDGLIDANPAHGVTTAGSGVRKHKLTDSELVALWQLDKVDGVRPAILAAMKLQLLTATRAAEVLSMRWSDVNAKRDWRVPAEIAKNGRDLLLPLSPAAWAIVQAQDPVADLIFPPHRSKGRISSSSYAQAVARVHAHLAAKAKETESEFRPFGSHDLRRTATTRMAELGISPHILEAILNHASGTVSGVAAVYNLASYYGEKRAALEAWAAELERLASGKIHNSTVLPMRRKRP